MNTLEISLKYAQKGMDAILDARHALENEMEIIPTSTNTIEFIQKEDNDYFNIQDEIHYILHAVNIPGNEYWWS